MFDFPKWRIWVLTGLLAGLVACGGGDPEEPIEIQRVTLSAQGYKEVPPNYVVLRSASEVQAFLDRYESEVLTCTAEGVCTRVRGTPPAVDFGRHILVGLPEISGGCGSNAIKSVRASAYSATIETVYDPGPPNASCITAVSYNVHFVLLPAGVTEVKWIRG